MAWSQFKTIPPISIRTAQRFWSKVDRRSPGQCWPWTAQRRNGYGFCWVPSGPFRAHRVAYFLSTGIDPGNMMICHRCDNRFCCNPNHMFLGTHQDNQDDKLRKGRVAAGVRHRSKTKPESVARGSSHWIAKLTEEEVVKIRERHDSGESFGSISRSLGVSLTAVFMAYHGRSWKHVPKPATLPAESQARRLPDAQHSPDSPAVPHPGPRAGSAE